jgi:hypothetical protein
VCVCGFGFGLFSLGDVKLRNLLLEDHRVAFPAVPVGRRTFTSVRPDAPPPTTAAPFSAHTHPSPSHPPSQQHSHALTLSHAPPPHAHAHPPVSVPCSRVHRNSEGELPFERYVHYPGHANKSKDLHPVVDALVLRLAVLGDVTPVFFHSEVLRVERALFFENRPYEPFSGHYDYERGLGSGPSLSMRTGANSSASTARRKASAAKRRRLRPRAALSQLERDLGSRLI